MNDRYELFEPHVPYARNILRKMKIDEDDIEDIIQDVLMRVTLDYSSDKGGPQPYFLKAAKNAGLDLQRKQARDRKRLAAYRPPESESFPDPAIVRIVDVLPDAERAVVKLTVIEGMSCRQAAIELGVSHPHVSKLQKQGLAMLREKLSA